MGNRTLDKDSNPNFDFQGYIDDVGVWNTNLSDQVRVFIMMVTLRLLIKLRIKLTCIL